MSFNLMAEGELDYASISARAPSFAPLELFPIPPSDLSEIPALGIACPLSRCGGEAARALYDLVRMLWESGARVYDLQGGTEIGDNTTLTLLCGNVI